MGKIRQSNHSSGESPSSRLREVRQLRYGERGRSALARELGIPVTSYVHYEAGRTLPAELMLRVSRIAGVRLEWLLTGLGPRESAPESPADDSPLPGRLKELLARRPQLADTVDNFLKLLEEVETPEVPPVRNPRRRTKDAGLIPVVGSTAAGTARFWSELPESHLGPQADARLEQVLAQHDRRVEQAGSASGTSAGDAPERVSLVQYSAPDDNGFLEFLSAAALKQRFPRAVAWRIDGQSMAPRYQDGDLVVTSPDAPAVPMHPCVARQAGQIGVNCKLFQTEGNDILLIPINEAYPSQRISRKKIEWAWRVVASVRLH